MRLLVIILAFRDPPLNPLLSLVGQELPRDTSIDIIALVAYPSACKIPQYIKTKVKCLVVKPPSKLQSVGERVGFSITVLLKYLEKIDKLKDYDYMLKLDDDVVLPKDFIKKNLKYKYIIMGYGPAMIINMRYYTRIFNAAWPISVADDVIVEYTLDSIWKSRSKVWEYIQEPIILRPIRPSVKRSFKAGYEFYRMGFTTPYMLLYLMKHVLKTARLRINLRLKIGILCRFIVQLLGYISALLTSTDKYKFSRVISLEQKYRIKRGFAKMLTRLLK